VVVAHHVVDAAPGVGAVNRASAEAALDDLYAQLPPLACKGRCADSCTDVDASTLERQRITRETGVVLAPFLGAARLHQAIAAGDTPRCAALGPLGTCRVYALRPFTCRAFGMVMTNPDLPHVGPMMCDHGCIPDGTLSFAEFRRIVDAIAVLSVEVTGCA
jgi:hypothetical protein